MNHRFLSVMLLTATLAVTGSAWAQTYYKWTDDNGTTHFTASPPVDRDYERVSTSGYRLGNADAVADLTDEQDSGSADDEVVMPRRAEPDIDPEVAAARCEQARANLFWLESKQRIRVEGEDGEQRYVDADERERLIEEAQAAIDDWCGEAGG